ncbi:ABC transporter permease [Occallatibacter savannae]|uniref:ABC transporter permease n=1 Tax=Occallatibacter savannae TaxID=1002691 RepID=UPI000D69645D|nr:ABC transporter permease [Occallatibacter savannae]
MFRDQLKQVLRRLFRAPLFTSIILITLSIGIGANAVVFGVVDGVLLKPLSYPQPDQLIGLWHSASGIGFDELNMAPFLYFIDREQSKTLEDVGMYNGDSLSITGVGQPEHISGLDVTDGVLPMLGVKPALGRIFTRQDDSPTAPKTILLSYAYWQRKFGGDQSVIGRSLTVDGTAREIIGVLPRNFTFLDDYDAAIFLPMQLDRSKTKLGNFSFRGIARMKPGVSLKQANADIDRLLPIAIHSFPAPDGFPAGIFESAKVRANLHTLKRDVIGDVGNVLWVLMGSIILVLLVACANVANLLLVRVEGRRQELAVRSALGAGRSSITAGLLVESLTLGVAGGIIGLALAFGALRLLVSMAPTGLPRLHEIGVNAPVLLFVLITTLFVSFVIGMLPILKYSGISMYTGLREGGRSGTQSRERQRARKVLVVIQVALALVLLICSGLMIRTFRALANVSPGFTEPASLEKFRIYIPETTIPETDRERVLRTEQAMADKLAAIPNVSSVAFSTEIPMDGHDSNDPIFAQDRTYREGELPPIRRFIFVSPGYFSTVGTPLVAGRDLTWAETYQKRPVALISENLSREYWGSAENAILKKIRVGTTDDWREIIGVSRDVYYDGVSKKAPSVVYWPVWRDRFEGQKEDVNRGLTFVIRSPRAGSAAFLTQVQQAVWSINGELPLAETGTVGELYTKSMARTSFTLIMLCVAGGMALLLGIVGIYGVISYAVSQRTREIGIRMALGAQRDHLTGMFVRQGLLLAGIGAVFGVAAAFGTMRFMSSILFKVSPMDPLTYSLSTAAVLAIALLACYVPSRRASQVNPVNALRSE